MNNAPTTPPPANLPADVIDELSLRSITTVPPCPFDLDECGHDVAPEPVTAVRRMTAYPLAGVRVAR